MYFLFLQIHSIFSILIFLFTLTNFSGTVHSRKGKKKKKKKIILLPWSAFHYAGQIPVLGIMKNSKP